jgi:23S rRNA (adenine-N6)-dimethyltransferase
VRPGDLVLDLGAGTGAITAELVAAGARVVAFELHPRRAEQLRRRFADAPVRVVRADVADLRLPGSGFRVVANPPFAALTAVLRQLTGPHSRLERADLVVPRHVARRWTSARAPGAGRWAATYAVEVTDRVPTSAFVPPPPADAVVLTVRRAAPPRDAHRPRRGVHRRVTGSGG